MAKLWTDALRLWGSPSITLQKLVSVDAEDTYAILTYRARTNREAWD